MKCSGQALVDVRELGVNTAKIKLICHKYTD